MRPDSSNKPSGKDAAPPALPTNTEPPAELQWRLQERVKELNLLHVATRLLQGNRMSLLATLTEIAALLPPAWQYPELCQARIRYGRTQATTPFWGESPWKLSTSFTTSDGREGVVEVIYLEQTPLAQEGPFLTEERALLDSITELLVAYLERQRAVRKGKSKKLEGDDDAHRFNPERVALLGELPDALDHDCLELHYQPKVDLRSGRTVEVEALVRWQHPDYGLIYPDRFVPLAESGQLINTLTHWVLTCAMRQWHGWKQRGLEPGLSINLSTRNLLDRTLRTKILELASAAGFPLDQLTLEISEGTVMADPARAKRVMSDLHDFGIQFTMEDYGTGQRAPSYLKDLPINKMKIDKSFVMDFATPRNATVVREAIELAHQLGMQVTAEGIEDDATREQLQQLGCEVGQGYLFARPLPEEELLTWFETSPWGYP
jgi:EAL domain-containing protein (putative c-di-GMP-specific phosphodiesterase class I)